MKFLKSGSALLIALCLFSGMPSAVAQTKAVSSIQAEDMMLPLEFLGSREFRGRNTPSPELDIASRYIALMARRMGLQPLLPHGSFYQDVPVEVTSISPVKSYLRLLSDAGEQKFFFPQSWGVSIRTSNAGSMSGSLAFVGYGLSAPDLNWDDYGDADLKGKIAVMLDVQLPQEHILKPADNRVRLTGRSRTLREKGALAVVSIISQEREAALTQKGVSFDGQERLRFPDVDMSQPVAAAAAPQVSLPAVPAAPFFQVEVRHEAAAAILGISGEDLNRMFETIGVGKSVSHRAIDGKTLEITLAFDKRIEKTRNVVGFVEGSDPSLRKEYVLIGSHHDHLPPREGRILPGADDNASGAVAMLELAQAFQVERPKRSVIFVWHTAEEKGLVGAYYFVQHSPVPVEKISAVLNLDMLSRNDPNGIYLIGSNKVSQGLDDSIRSMNDRYIHLSLDYRYEDPGHPDRFFFRSDQFPYIRYGVPGVWFFCGTTEDYHQEGDVFERADLKKMEKVTRLAFLAAMDIGNKPGLLKLDINPDITARGKQNFKFDWWKSIRASTPPGR